uniref:Ubiquinol-cytochrome C reductase hinge domain-containing protein n=1 Tax=Cuerna arida TaxID=1464854 RepID=A0A1B6ETM6_9HEMI
MESEANDINVKHNTREEHISKRLLDSLQTPEKQSTQQERTEKEERKGENGVTEKNVPAKPTYNVFSPGNSPYNPNLGDMKMKLKLLQGEGSGNDDEVVDPQDTLKEKCGQNNECAKLAETLNECNDRVNSKEKTNETCEQELYDFVECVAACVAKDLFKFLK